MRTRISMWSFTVLGVALAVGLALAVSPYASSNPDGLEKVAIEEGFVDTGKLHAIQEDAPVPDYVFPGVGGGRLATGVAGFVGTLGVFAIAYGIGWALRRRTGGGLRGEVLVGGADGGRGAGGGVGGAAAGAGTASPPAG